MLQQYNFKNSDLKVYFRVDYSQIHEKKEKISTS